MRFPKIFTIFSAEEQSHPHNILSDSSIPVLQNLIKHPANSRTDGFPQSFLRQFCGFVSGSKFDGCSRTEEEEKVYSWLYALAQSDKDLAFEYVRSTERGLSFNEAERRLRENGPNIPLEYSFRSWSHLFWNAFFHPFNIILILLSALSYIANDSSNGCIMLALVFVSVFIRFYQENSSSRAAMRLNELVTYPVKVQRCAGRVIQTELIVQIDQKDVVPGDTVIFQPGDVFPGDVRLLSSKHLVVSQSSLTGESWTTEKAADVKEGDSTPLLELRNICFMGTNVVSGGGSGLVVSTGCNTYMSTMYANTGKQKPPDGFENGIRRISYFLIGVMLVVITIIIMGYYLKSHFLSNSILFGLSVACSLTPNMLPLIVNTSLAKGALGMARDRCIVKSMDAIRHMGCMDILCMDKTGTLTMNHPIVVSHPDPWGLPKQDVLRFAFLNSYFKTDQKYPLDDAILAYAYTNGYRFKPSEWIKLDEIPFDFMRRRVTVILQSESNIAGDRRSGRVMFRFMITKGALEQVVGICSFIQQPDKGTVTTFSAQDHHRILNMVEELTNQGLRVIAVAAKRIETDMSIPSLATDYNIIEANMVFLGVITFFDPPKDSAKQALWRLADRGVKPKVLTGDSLSLAVRICDELGIRTTNVTTGPELELLDQDSFHKTVKSATVLARLTPTQKLRVVRSLQKVGGHVVGFLGDGVNDSLAIDAADIGVSVDSGASVAKDSADIVLLEKDLNVLVAGVEHGRLTLGNTMKYIKMSVIANIGSVVSLLIATLWLDFEPLTPGQLLTQTFIYSVGQITIPWDKLEEDYVRTPQKWSLIGLPMFILWNGSVCILIDLSNLVFLWCYNKRLHAVAQVEAKFFHSAFFLEGLLMPTLIFHLIRTEKIPFIQEMASWPVMCSTAAVSAVGIAIPFTPVGEVMGLVSLPLWYLGFLVVLFLGYFTMGQIVKKLYIWIYKSWL